MKKLKHLFLIVSVFLMLPLLVNAEETTNGTTETNDTIVVDNSASVKLYYDSETGEEITLTQLPQTDDTHYNYKANIKRKENNILYLKVQPNYEYKTIEYNDSDNLGSFAGVVLYETQSSGDRLNDANSTTSLFIDKYANLNAGTIYAIVTKKDDTQVTYAINLFDQTSDVQTNEQITKDETSSTINDKIVEKKEKNPNTGDNTIMYLGAGLLLIGILGVCTKKLKNN